MLLRATVWPAAARRPAVLVLIPDGTRTMPMPLMFETLERELGPRVAALDYLVALGTHPPMTDAQLSAPVGRPVVDGRAGARRIFNHRWDDPSTFVHLGTIPAREIAELTGGRLDEDVPVALNRLVVEYDHVLICGPVFPHEVVGFSGGTKYLFPGIAAPEIIHFTHWLGALITSYEVIGTMDTPVRAVIDRAAALLHTPLSLLALVVTHEGVAGMFCGDVARRLAAGGRALGPPPHRVGRQAVRRVLAVMPPMYDDLWTAAKGMYKTEPAVADGGEVIIYAPHVSRGQPCARQAHRRDRLSLPRLLPRAMGPLRAVSRRHPGALDARQGAGHVRRRVRRRDAAHQGHAGHRHSARALRAYQSRLPGSGNRRPRTSDGIERTLLVVPRAGEMLVSGRARPAERFIGTSVTYKMGVVGLGVMGANLARNIESKGFPVVGYDLDAAKTQAFLEGAGKGAAIAARTPERSWRCSNGRAGSC